MTCAVTAVTLAVGASLVVGAAPASAAAQSAPTAAVASTGADLPIRDSWTSVASVNGMWHMDMIGRAKYYAIPTSTAVIAFRSTHGGTLVIEDEQGHRVGSRRVLAQTTSTVELTGLRDWENDLRLFVETDDGRRTTDALIVIDNYSAQLTGSAAPMSTTGRSGTETVRTVAASSTPGAAATPSASTGLDVVRWTRTSTGFNVLLRGEPRATVSASAAGTSGSTQLAGDGEGILSLRASDAFRWQVRFVSETGGRHAETTAEVGDGDVLVPTDGIAATAVATPILRLTTVRVAGTAGFARVTDASGRQVAADWVDGSGSTPLRIRALPADLGPLTVTVDGHTTTAVVVSGS